MCVRVCVCVTAIEVIFARRTQLCILSESVLSSHCQNCLAWFRLDCFGGSLNYQPKADARIKLSVLKGFCHGESFIKLQRIIGLRSFECLQLEGFWNAEEFEEV